MTTPPDGHLVHFTLHVPNLGRGRKFYGNLLGWELDEGDHPLAANLLLSGGLAEGDEPMTFYFWSNDPYATVARVQELGGASEGAETGPSGKWAMCRDPQGGQFSVSWLRPDIRPASLEPCLSPGELGYWVIPVKDVPAAREFYGSVFGWEFAPGEQYAHITNVATPGGLARMDGESPKGWFRVNNMAESLAKVESLGGNAGAASTSESGVSASCRDDQGVAFDLWQPG
jgi:predicted enzyme related to lactoylglutathione lyase